MSLTLSPSLAMDLSSDALTVGGNPPLRMVRTSSRASNPSPIQAPGTAAPIEPAKPKVRSA